MIPLTSKRPVVGVVVPIPTRWFVASTTKVFVSQTRELPVARVLTNAPVIVSPAFSTQISPSPPAVSPNPVLASAGEVGL